MRRMVNGVPMALMWKGISLERLSALNELRFRAVDNLEKKHGGIKIYSMPDNEFDDLLEAEFQRLAQAASKKAAWNLKPALKKKVK